MVVVTPLKNCSCRCNSVYQNAVGKKTQGEISFYVKTYARKGGIWSRGYCVSCIGLNEKEILTYVEHQEKEDKGQLQLSLP